MRQRVTVLGLCLALISVATAGAAPVTILSYDISATPPSGTGDWQHVYTGTMTPIGGGNLAYSGGSGTLNDGVIGTSELVTHLLQNNLSPVITLHLGGVFTINTISLFGGTFENAIPGFIAGVSVSVGGPATAFVTAPFGPDFGFGQVNDMITVTGSALASVSTSTIVLSGWTGNFFDDPDLGPLFSLTEIMVDGTPASSGPGVPEPSLVIGLGLALVGFVVLARWRAVQRRTARRT